MFTTNLNITAFANNWKWFLIWGLILIALGIIAISAVSMTTILSVVFFGFLLFISGVVIIFDTFTFWFRKWSGFFLHLGIGVLYLLVGCMLIKNPITASISITLLLGIFYLIIGLLRIFYSSSLRAPQWGWSLISGILAFILGVLILASWPTSGLYIIGLFIGIDLFFVGLAYVMAALAVKL